MSLTKILKNKIITGILIGLVITIFLAILISLNVFQGLHLKFADSLYALNKPSKDIVIVAIDTKSVMPEPDGLGNFSNWSRANYTKLLEKLAKEDPAVIAFDIYFRTPTANIAMGELAKINQEADKTESNKEKLEIYQREIAANSNPLKNKIDDELQKKMSEFDNIILAFNADPVLPAFPLKKFSDRATIADVHTIEDQDGIIRRTRPNSILDGTKYDNIALASAKKFLKKSEIDLPLENGEFMVNYFNDPFKFPAISFVDVVNGNFETGTFKDKIILIGVTTFRSIEDQVLTPRANTIPMPGVEFRANEIQTILEGKFLNNQNKTAQILTIFTIAAALTIAFNYLGIALAILLALTSIGLYIGVAHFFYSRGLIVNMVYPFLAIVLSYLASWVYRYFIADKGKREIKSAFSHYLSDELVNQIAQNPDMVKLGGEKKAVTVFFSDIKGSTTYSEKTPIELWVQQINEYFTAMEYVLQSYGGTLDKYEGDAIMGFWNAPVNQQDHIARGFVTALAMKKTLLQLHQKWQGEGKPLIEFRIGINTGEALVGNFGSKNRFDYTLMGDTVNTASRLESSANKAYGTSICVAGFENAIAPEALAQFIMREMDMVLLPGKKEPVRLYELVCMADEATDDIRNNLLAYANGLAAYRKKDFNNAVTAFESLKNDPAAGVMLQRCQTLSSGGVVSGLGTDMVFSIANK